MNSLIIKTHSSNEGIIRLGKCEVCDFNEAKYTCPKCEVKTCQLSCLNIHKKELDCNGIRDKTKFVPIHQMSEMEFMSDYNFLEECTRYVSDRKRDKLKRYTRQNRTLPGHLFKLRTAASAANRKIRLSFLLPHFTRHKLNTTFYDWKTKIIYWRIEWIFPNAESVKFVDERCSEQECLSNLLVKYTQIDNDDGDKLINQENDDTTGTNSVTTTAATTNKELIRKKLQFYMGRGLNNLRILLKSEGVRKSGQRFYDLNIKKTLADNLKNKVIVEFPVIYVVYSDIVQEFDVIDSDDDIEQEVKLHLSKYNSVYKGTNGNGNIETIMEPIKKRVKREKQQNNITKNLIFTDENNLDESTSSDSE